jgi:Zn-dependent protease with chaperone function
MFANKQLLYSLFLCLVTACLSACTSTLPTAVDVDRKQNLAAPQVAADAVSKVVNFSLRSSYQLQGLLDTPDVQYQNARAEHIFQRLIKHVDKIHPQASVWAWEIHVVDRGIVNAYTVGAGKVMVFRGLIEHMALTEEELAFIIAHEIGHNLRLHTRETLSNIVPIYAAGVGLSQALTPWSSAMIMDYGVEKTMSRTQEIEADRVGLELMARAGFQPGAAATAFAKFYELEDMSRNTLVYEKIIPRWTYLQTHPLSEDRETDVKQQSEKVTDIYALSDKYIAPAQALSQKTSVNLDYIDDHEKLYWMGRIAPQTVITRLVHADTDVSYGSDLGYGWMLKRTSQGGLNLHVGYSWFHGDAQIKGNFGGAFTELGWVFNPHWQLYGRLVSAEDLNNSVRKKQKLSIGLRWGNFNSGHLYLEAGQGRAKFNRNQDWKNDDLVEFGYAYKFGLL